MPDLAALLERARALSPATSYEARIVRLEGMAHEHGDAALDHLERAQAILSSSKPDPVREGWEYGEGGGEPDEASKIPEAFRGLMLDGESAAKFTERMRRRWVSLQQYRIDGSKPTNARALPDMTEEEEAELRDLEERNKRSKWLD